MANRFCAILLFCFFLLIGTNTYAGSAGLEKFGDFTNIAMPLAALGFTGIHQDKQGAIQFVKSFALTIGAVYVLKPTVNEKRPNGGKWSFPSGHTASAFSSASFLQMRYGWKYGIPAYALATVVGYS